MRSLLCASLFLAGSLASAEEITGYISDSHCGAKHDAVSEKNTKCVKDMCLKGGADPVLVKDGKVWKFDAASREKALGFAGESVKVQGTTQGDTLKVDSIEKASS